MIVFSSAAYVLGRELGFDEAIHEFRAQVLEPRDDSIPAAKTAARLRQFEEIVMHVDCAATSIGRARSRAMHTARMHSAKADVWVCCDDDVEADTQTLKWLVQAARDTRGICVAPCLLRKMSREPIVNVILTEAVHRPVGDGGLVIGCRAGGFGLVAIHQDAIEACYTSRPELFFIDSDGEQKLGMFLEVIEDGKWWTEDLSFFCKWLPSSVRVEALITGRTVHAGRLLELPQVLQLPRMAYAAPNLVVT